eukprot:763415-Hanusia_phi.AAC.2
MESHRKARSVLRLIEVYLCHHFHSACQQATSCRCSTEHLPHLHHSHPRGRNACGSSQAREELLLNPLEGRRGDLEGEGEPLDAGHDDLVA